MKTVNFCLDGEAGMAEWAAFLSDPAVIIKDRIFSPETDKILPSVYYAYESLEEQGIAEAQRLVDDQENLKRLCKLAGDFVGDNIYAGLKNQGQRQMYMTSKGIGKQDGIDVIELLKPEMQAVVEWGRSA